MPPNFVDKPQPEKSKVHESEDVTTTSKKTAAQDVRKFLQPVKRRKLLVCPVSLSTPTPSPVEKESSAISATTPAPGLPVAFTQVPASPARVTEVHMPHAAYEACSLFMHTCGSCI